MIYRRHSSGSRLNLAYAFLVLLVGLLLLAWLWRQVAVSVGNGGGDFSWVEQRGENLTVHTYLSEYAKLINWQIPGNTLVETAFGYGRYQWKNVFELAELDGRSGPTLLRTSQETLGLPVMGWQANGKTNLSLWDRLKWWYLSKFKTKQRLIIDLGQTAAWQKDNLSDGSRVWEISFYPLDQIVNRETFSQRVAAENLSVSLINDQGFSRVIKNHGIELVSVSQAELSEKTLIYFREKEQQDSQTLKWLKRLLPQAEVQVGISGAFWSDIVIVLGRDYNGSKGLFLGGLGVSLTIPGAARTFLLFSALIGAAVCVRMALGFLEENT